MKNDFYYLFVGLLVLLAVESFLGTMARSGPLLQLAFTSVLVAGVSSLAADRAAFRAGIGLVVVGFGSAVGYLLTDSAALQILDLVAIACFCVLAIAASTRRVLFEPGTVNPNQIVGALCIYLLMGMLWAVLFALVEVMDPAAFSYAGPASQDPLHHLLYYSFVTLTTLGYGDIAPVHPVARTLAYLEAVIGQLYVAVLIAGMVGQHVASMGPGQNPERHPPR